LEVAQIRSFEEGLYHFFKSAKPGFVAKLTEQKSLDDAMRQEVKEALLEYKQRFLAEKQGAAAAR
ncbi:MAG: F0F1 ATP synthase subunit alpha, partial [Acidobacteria bacterium]|nr:F0F1 ATP synthase subunit alpha [Acidobacteriota bacterium]